MPPTENKCRLTGLGVYSLTVSDFTKAEEFYCRRLGFHQIFVTRSIQGVFERGLMILERDRVSLSLSKPFGERYSEGKTQILVSDMSALFDEFTAKGVEINFDVTNQVTGYRLMRVYDPDGNQLEFIMFSKWEGEKPSKSDLEARLQAHIQKLLSDSWKKHRRY